MEDTADTGQLDCSEVWGTGCMWDGDSALTAECHEGMGEEPYGNAGVVEGSGCGCSQGPAPNNAIWVALLFVWLRRFVPLLLLVPRVAEAVDAQHLHVVDGGDFAALMDADQGEAWSAATWLGVNWGKNLVMLYDAPDGGPLLESVQTMDLGASVNLGGYARMGMVIPTYSNIEAPGPQLRPMIGDMTFWTALPLSSRDKTVQTAISLSADLPTGQPEYWLGDAHGGATASLNAEFPAGPFDALVNLGPRFQRNIVIPGGGWGTRWLYGAGLRAEPGGPVFLTGEVHGAVPVVPWMPLRVMKPVELTGTLGTRLGKTVALSAGGGTGLSRGLGSPTSRVLVLADFRQRDVGDRDADGVSDAVDLCRTEPEDLDEYRDGDGCPDLDNDRDGIADIDDVCPNQAETRNGLDDDDGCPDGVSLLAVTVEVAPGHFPPETATVFIGEDERPALLGEPVFARLPFGSVEVRVEAEGFSTQVIPTELEARDVPLLVTLQPTPSAVAKTPGAILERTVRFEEDSAELLESAVLEELLAYLQANPELELLRIEGHADSTGSPRYNYELSVERAEAVRDWLLERDVASERLQAVGSGEARPGDDGGRRVSFHVLIFDPATLSEAN